MPSKNEGPPSAVKLKKENEALKSKLDAMERQMASVQKQIVARNEQDQHLRDNIMLARKEVGFLLTVLLNGVDYVSRPKELWLRLCHLLPRRPLNPWPP